jgi:hypothetical protein
MVQEEHGQKRLYQSQCATRDLERMDVQGETSAETEMQEEHKEMRC